VRIRRNHLRWLLTATVAAILSAASSGGAAGPTGGAVTYLPEDAVLSARQMHTFEADGRTVSVLVGDFRLTIGRRSITGRDAVMWVSERQLGEQSLRDIELYVEGRANRPARVVEADGTTTTDHVLYVTPHHKGDLRARVGRHGDGRVRSLPLVRRATKLRAELQEADQAATAPAPETRPARPAPPTAVVTRRRPPRLLPARPVSFRADSVTSEVIPDPRDPKREIRVSIAKGGVYLSQGDINSDLFLEMRSDAAVAYSLPGQGDGPTAGGLGEKVVAVYLEGDVILRRGERTVTGERLFYDFTTGRALFVEPVLRTIQEQRNFPIYIRGQVGRQTEAHPEPGEDDLRLRGFRWYFRDGLVTTSDFHTPEYHIGARRIYLEDTTLYDETGTRVSERSWRTKLVSTTFNVQSLPVLWWPRVTADAREGHTALQSVQVGRHGRFGWGAETKWFLFSLLGVPSPPGTSGRLEADWYERGFVLSPSVTYDRPRYSGYVRTSGMVDTEGLDDFGTDRKDVAADELRGRALWRHKQFLPRDWQLQMELSYLCDENYLEQFFPSEFWTEKEQETLLYAKKQEGTMAGSLLAKFRINDFQTQTEALPEAAGFIIGQPLLDNRLTYHGESRLGFVRYRSGDRDPRPTSDIVGRADMRHEVDAPVDLGPVRVMPFVAGRLTGWTDAPGEDGLFRPWGQVGVNAATHFWRVYPEVKSRLWALDRLRHVITPYGRLFMSCTDVQPDGLVPYDPNVEGYVRRLGGGSVGVRQVWQTRRGPAGRQHSVDWLRLDVRGAFFIDSDTDLPSDGRYFLRRPVFSLPRDSINADLTWHVSDATSILADVNYDVSGNRIGRGNLGVAVTRSPRLSYYAGVRAIEPLDSTVGTLGFNYRISRKYSLSVFEQYDFDFRDGHNLATAATITRKFSRWHLAFTFIYDATQEEVGVILSLWPEGIPEARVGSGRLGLPQASASE
jgi:hypothetical protein